MRSLRASIVAQHEILEGAKVVESGETVLNQYIPFWSKQVEVDLDFRNNQAERGNSMRQNEAKK